MMNICKNCGTEFSGAHCPTCGQAADESRITVKDTFRGLLEVFSVPDNTFYRTARGLFTRPGHMVREYLIGERVKYLKPLSMLTLLVAVYIIFMNVTATDESSDEAFLRENIGKFASLGSVGTLIIKLFQNKVYGSLIQSLLCTIPFTWLFRKYKITFKDGTADSLNLAEQFYTSVYVSCQLMILTFLDIPLKQIFNYNTGATESIVFFLVFYTWCYKQLLGISWAKSLWKVIVGFVLTELLFIVIILVLLIITAIFDPSLVTSMQK